MTAKEALDYLWSHIKDTGIDLDKAYEILNHAAEMFDNFYDEDQEFYSLDHLFEGVEYDLVKLSLVDFDKEENQEERSCARYELAEEEEE
jgi:hypothetical protein